ncbi:SDR family NAD(P)-dependent oxidoreductase [Paenibacillus sp. sgz5001063]|uniref:type I polyketide synthase n=1 Tax=Paenibacillus sp. sgz5001063 TaxID=3242474 RepID=UPI0036D364C5
MKKVQNYIFEQVAARQLSPAEAKQLLNDLQGSSGSAEEDIAVIGMSGKFPGAENLDEYWENLENERNCIGRFPQSRIKWESLLLNPTVQEILAGGSMETDKDGGIVAGIGGFLSEIDAFDAPFFKLSPREAKFMDPSQRLFLQTCHEAFEDAGYGGEKMMGTRTGVFVGKDHANLPIYRLLTEPDPMHLTGSWPGILSRRISYLYNFRGPSIVVDTACSAGLVSIHLACDSLRKGECDFAVAGGVQVQCMSIEGESGPMDLNMVESDDHMVRTFDRNATGTVWGEAVAAVLLKPLSQALADGDNIHAVIKGSAINNDGASNGITAPNASAQEDVICRAWEAAGISPETIQYIEAHGTGTALGDPIEIKGITNAFRRYTDAAQFCGIGAVKTSIGHTVAASGVAALIKVILSMKHKIMPASIHFMEPNPYINFPDSPLYVNDIQRKWEKGQAPRRAGISSFGFSGTNAHLIIEEAPPRASDRELADTVYFLPISAIHEGTLQNLVESYRNYVEQSTELPLADFCYTAAVGRGHYSHRLALVFRSREELLHQLESITRAASLSQLSAQQVWYGGNAAVAGTRGVEKEGALSHAERYRVSNEADQLLASGDEDGTSLNKMCLLGSMYVQGAELRWAEMYKDQNRQMLPLPVYVFDKLHCWAGSKVLSAAPTATSKDIPHPLLDRVVTDSYDRLIFETRLSVESHWILKDHTFMDAHIVPGVTYVEWGREACSRYFNSNDLHFKDIVFLTPLILQPDESRLVQTVLKKERDHVGFMVTSQPESGKSWVVHAEGRAYLIEQPTEKFKNLSDLQELCPIFPPMEPFNSVSGKFHLSERWDNLLKARTDESEDTALLLLSIPQNYEGEMDNFFFYPSLLDNAVNPMIKKLADVYLPFTFKSFTVRGRMPQKFYSFFQKKTNHRKSNETLEYDVVLMDLEGRVFAEIEDYSIKRISMMEQVKFKQMSNQKVKPYVLNWVEEPQAHTTPNRHQHVLVFSDNKQYSDSLVQRMEEEGRVVIVVGRGPQYNKKDSHHFTITDKYEDILRLIEEIQTEEFTQIINFFTIEEKREINTLYTVVDNPYNEMIAVFQLVKALLLNKVSRPLDIVLIGRNVHEVNAREMELHPLLAAAFGLGKVLKDEYEHMQTRSLDLDSELPIEQLMLELDHSGSAYSTAYRQGIRYVQEFGMLNLEQLEQQSLEIRRDGLYLITGGTGGLGLEMAKYLAHKNKVRLALFNRTALPERSYWETVLAAGEDPVLCRKISALLEVERLGSTVECISVDVADGLALQAAVSGLRSKYGEVRGVIHAAGVAGDGFLIHKEVKDLVPVMSPKVTGTLNLHSVTAQDGMDFFIQFSSIASLMGGPGQGDYTAANFFLDAFSDYANKLGRRTISINWPSWKETGMAVDYGAVHDESMFQPISTAHALDIMDMALLYGMGHIIPAEVNTPLILEHMDHLPIRLSQEIRTEMEKNAVLLKGKKKASSTQKVWEQITVKGKGELTDVEKKLTLIWAEVLDLDVLDVGEQFNNLGGDSILSIQLHKQINTAFPGVMDVSDVFSYPTIADQARYIASKLEPQASADQLFTLLDAVEAGEISVKEGLGTLNVLKSEV